MTSIRLKRIRQLLWLYFWLLILEGALRKWVAPGLSSPLLLVRDPVAILALCWGLPLLRLRQWWQWIEPLLLIAMASFILAITAGHGDIPTAAFGARILFTQLPLIFLYAAVFDRDDAIRFAWALAWFSIPMTFLIVSQSNLPSSHILNVAVGGEGTSAFSGALDRFRPSGTFSFTNGITSFYALASSGLFTLLYSAKLNQPGRILTFLAGISLIVAQPVSMSRGLLAGYLTVIAGLIVALLLSRTKLFPIIAGLLSLIIMVNIASNIPAFQETSKAFSARWETASSVESTQSGDAAFGGGAGQFRSRVLGGFTDPFANLDHRPFFGYGIGMGTNVGAQRISGEVGFILGESSWDTILAELGLPLGLAFIIWRTLLGLWMLRLALRHAISGNIIPMIWLATSFLLVANGQIGQPTALGFIIVSAGITLAACNVEDHNSTTVGNLSTIHSG